MKANLESSLDMNSKQASCIKGRSPWWSERMYAFRNGELERMGCWWVCTRDEQCPSRRIAWECKNDSPCSEAGRWIAPCCTHNSQNAHRNRESTRNNESSHIYNQLSITSLRFLESIMETSQLCIAKRRRNLLPFLLNVQLFQIPLPFHSLRGFSFLALRINSVLHPNKRSILFCSSGTTDSIYITDSFRNPHRSAQLRIPSHLFSTNRFSKKNAGTIIAAFCIICKLEGRACNSS